MLVIENQGTVRQRLVPRQLVRLAVVMTLLALGTQAATAQRYDTIDPKVTGRAAKALKGQVAAAVRSSAAYQEGGKELIDRYYKTVLFPRMTQTSAADLEELGDRREDLLKVLRGTGVPEAQQQLTQLSLGAMRVIARGNYHPAVRYNAALVLGMLDEKVAEDNQAPVVLPAATEALLELLESPEFKGVPVHPSVKAAALIGLERHARFGLQAQYTERVTQAARSVFEQTPEDLGVDAEVAGWLQCQAVRVLVIQEGPTPQLQTLLAQHLADTTVSLEDRCFITGQLARMDYTTVAAEADVQALVVPLGKLTQAVVAAGAKRAQAYEDLVLGGGNFRSSRNFGGRNQEAGPQLERRELLSSLTLIEEGAKAISKGLAEPGQEQLRSLLDLLQPVMKISRDAKESDLDLMEKVLQLKQSVDPLVTSWQPVEEAANAEEALEEALDEAADEAAAEPASSEPAEAAPAEAVFSE